MIMRGGYAYRFKTATTDITTNESTVLSVQSTIQAWFSEFHTNLIPKGSSQIGMTISVWNSM